METIRKEVQKARLERSLQKLDGDLEKITDARGRVAINKGLLKPQRDFLTSHIDELITVREDIVDTLPESARLAFDERTRSYYDLRENILSCQAIKPNLLLLFNDLIKDVENDIKEQKHKVEAELKDLTEKWSRSSRLMVTMSFCIIFRYILRKCCGA